MLCNSAYADGNSTNVTKASGLMVGVGLMLHKSLSVVLCAKLWWSKHETIVYAMYILYDVTAIPVSLHAILQ
jgi:hypothetical protein